MRTPVDAISKVGRITSGVKLMNVSKESGEKVASITKVRESEAAKNLPESDEDPDEEYDDLDVIEESDDIEEVDETEDTVSLTVAADQKSAVYTNADGETTDMVNAADQGPAALYAGEGAFHVEAYNADATVTATLYDDASCTVERLKADNRAFAEGFRKSGEKVAWIENDFMGTIRELVETF